MKQILVLFPCTPEFRALLEQTAQHCRILYKEPNWSREKYETALKGTHIILGEPKNEDFRFCEKLEWMQSPSSGVNYYVQGGAFPQNAILSSMTGNYGNIIAEHMLSLILALCRRLPEYHSQQQQHIWQLRLYDKQLEDATMVILGAGSIGTTLARFLRPMVKKIIGVRRTLRDCPDCFDEMVTLDRLDQVLPQGDIIACSLPHTAETVHLLDERRLRLMKPDAVLVNGGRGSLIDQQALCQLLQEGHFWGVGLDVATPEPLPKDHPLWDQPRLILTPHASGNSYSTDSPLYRKLWKSIIRNLERYLKGGPVQNQIDFSIGYAESAAKEV